MKEVLSAVWMLCCSGRKATLDALKKELKGCDTDVESGVEELIKKGYIGEDNQELSLTEKGRSEIRVVVCGGVYDILHPGHAFILGEAKALGDVLVAIVARSSTVENRKRIPIVPEDQRVEMVSHLKPVDVALLGHEGDPLKIIEEIRPDVIALGPDQHHDEEKIRVELAGRGLRVEVVRIREYRECELNSTKAILQKIIERNYPNSRVGG